MRRVRAVMLLVAVALVATGCYRSDLSVDVNDDGSGTFTMIAAIDRDAFDQLGDLGFSDEDLGEGGELGDPCEQLEADADTTAEDLPEGATVEPYEDGDFCGVRFTAEFSSPEELSELVGTVAADSTGTGSGSFASFTIEKDGDDWVFEAVPAATGDTGGMPGFEDMLEGASNIVRVKLPGRQEDHNADRIDDDGTMIWNLDVLGDTRTLHARTVPGDPIRDETITDAGEDIPGSVGGDGGGDDDGGSSTLWIVLGLVVVAAAVVGLVLWQRTRTKAAPALAGGAPMAGGLMAPTEPPATAPTAPPAAAPSEPPAAAPGEPTQPTQPSPSSGGPQWDPQRNAYIQWDPAGNRWMQYDDAAKEWKPIT